MKNKEIEQENIESEEKSKQNTDGRTGNSDLRGK